MGFGDRVRIEMLDRAGASIFGAIAQKVVEAAAPNAAFSADHVRFRADFVCFTPGNRPSWWCPRSSGFDPGCVKTVLWRPKRNINSLSRPQPQ